jgi:FlaA1/EpsC-like NDP-sugar epimerase
LAEQKLKDSLPQVNIVSEIADIKDRHRITGIFNRYKPGVVFHAAAHKHVPYMEKSPEEAVKNNILGTRVVCDAAMACGCQKFILISTDKAVNPASIMGATKRATEIIALMMNNQGKTKFAAVRFGNILGSRGSVLPLFERQIETGGPITITHPEMTRYFMTVNEAAQLVIQAGAMANGGEIFILDMGEPICIKDLALKLSKLKGLDPDEDIYIKYIGIRPGEKIFETLIRDEEKLEPTRHKKIFSVSNTGNVDYRQVKNMLKVFEDEDFSYQDHEIRELLGQIN